MDRSVGAIGGASVGTPFHPRTSAACETPFWYSWPPYHVVDIYTDSRQELRAMREKATLNEMSPLSKIRVSGPDAAAFANRLITRDALAQEVGQVLYAPWCNEHGKVVGDGLVLRLDMNTYMFVAGPSGRWFRSNSAGLDVEIDDVSPHIGILALQGPRSRDVLERATGEDWSQLRFSRLRRTEIGGVEVDVIRQGFTGELGYELWVVADGAVPMWDALTEAGEPYGLRPAGEYAIDIARVEAGLLIIGADYVGAGPDPFNVHFAETDQRPSSPFELRLGRFVDFAKQDYVGRQALLDERARGGPPRRMVGLELDWRALVGRQIERGVMMDLVPRVSREPLPVLDRGRGVGLATSVTWGPSVGKLIGFGHLEKRYAQPSTALSVRWTLGHEQITIDARVVDLPFRAHRRA